MWRVCARLDRIKANHLAAQQAGQVGPPAEVGMEQSLVLFAATGLNSLEDAVEGGQGRGHQDGVKL